ncbi:MAG TPA: LytR C-terminal domain-containing protein [Dermatophilaceae bacterium]|nr:LytR C-terminal domain-containing protein [Dermatophilaceae bacterium]
MSGVEEASEREYHVRQQRRSAVTLLVVMLGLAGAFFYASTYFRDSDPEARPCTTVIASGELSPADISVNVYNATGHGGLARAIGNVMTDRGFNVRDIDNDPEGKTIKGVAEVRHGPEGLESAKVVAKHFPGAVLVADKREGDTVDLAIGNRYRNIGPIPPVVTPSVKTIPCPQTTATQ